MAYSSPRTPAGTTRRVGIEGGMARITTSNHGAHFSSGRGSRSWSTTIVHRACRLSDSLGLQVFGGTVYPVRSNNAFERTVILHGFLGGYRPAAQRGR